MNTRKISSLVLGLLIALSGVAQDVTTLYNEGLELRKAGKYKEAMDKYSQVTLKDPKHFNSLYELGWCHNELGSYDDALIVLRRARNVNPGIAKIHFELGYAFEKKKLYDSALNAYNKCLDLSSDYYSALMHLAFVHYFKEEYADALDFFEEYEAMVDPEDLDDYIYFFRKGYAYNELGEYNSAVEALRTSISLDDTYIESYLELGYASKELRLADDAIKYYQKAIDIDSKRVTGYNGMGQVYRDLKKDYTTAISWFDKSLALDARNQQANYGKAYCLNSLSRYDEALFHAREALKTNSKYSAAYIEVGYAQYMKYNNEEALTNFKKAIEYNSQSTGARYYAGLVYIAQKNKAMAQKMVDELKQLKSSDATALQEKVNAMQ